MIISTYVLMIHGTSASIFLRGRARSRPFLRLWPRSIFPCLSVDELQTLLRSAAAHYGEDAWTDWGPAQDAGSDRVMAAVLNAESPGLVLRALAALSAPAPPRRACKIASLIFFPPP
jgi:hypothetical protein